MTNQFHGPEGSTQIPVQIKPAPADILEVHRDVPQVIQHPHEKIWTPDGNVATNEHANKVLDDFTRFMGGNAVKH